MAQTAEIIERETPGFAGPQRLFASGIKRSPAAHNGPKYTTLKTYGEQIAAAAAEYIKAAEKYLEEDRQSTTMLNGRKIHLLKPDAASYGGSLPLESFSRSFEATADIKKEVRARIGGQPYLCRFTCECIDNRYSVKEDGRMRRAARNRWLPGCIAQIMR